MPFDVVVVQCQATWLWYWSLSGGCKI